MHLEWQKYRHQRHHRQTRAPDRLFRAPASPEPTRTAPTRDDPSRPEPPRPEGDPSALGRRRCAGSLPARECCVGRGLNPAGAVETKKVCPFLNMLNFLGR